MIMRFKIGDFVVVNDPTPYLDDGVFTDDLYFNDRMRVFIGRIFIVSKIQGDNTYKLKYIDKHECLEGRNDVITRWSWNEKWLMLADEFAPDEIDCSDLPDIMSMIRG
jgi:hypothetical protein